jgi:hypothetical protein
MPLPSSNCVLDQEKLDVAQKTRANLFNWRGQFTPELIDYLLDTYSSQGDIIVDPFAGSGTVLLESVRKGLACQGLEINPAAYAMSHFYTLCNIELGRRMQLFQAIEKRLVCTLQPLKGLPVVEEEHAFREQHRNLLDFARSFCASLPSGIEKTIVLNMLFISEGHKSYDLETSLLTSFQYLRSAALALPYTELLVSVGLEDARTIHLGNTRPNLIVTSPPYINVFNYHQNHRAILEAVGWDMLRVAPSEFGSNRKNRGNRFKTVIQYCLDMDQALRSFWQSLQNEGLLILVIGKESNVRGLPFYNGQIVCELAENMRGFETLARHERKFSNRFGDIIKEDIFVFQKRTAAPCASDATRIAVKHLSATFPAASEEVRKDVLEAMLNSQAVLPSPHFKAKEAFSLA